MPTKQKVKRDTASRVTAEKSRLAEVQALKADLLDAAILLSVERHERALLKEAHARVVAQRDEALSELPEQARARLHKKWKGGMP